jgi:hypothetical protein
VVEERALRKPKPSLGEPQYICQTRPALQFAPVTAAARTEKTAGGLWKAKLNKTGRHRDAGDDHPGLNRHYHEKTSFTRYIAGCWRLFT